MKEWKKNSLGIFEQNFSQKISYPEHGNDNCFAVEQSSPWFIQRNELILTYLNEYAKSGDFLDIGGGNGFQAKAIVDSNYNGKVILIEPGGNGCRNAKKRGLDFVYQGFFRISLLRSFQLVIVAYSTSLSILKMI